MKRNIIGIICILAGLIVLSVPFLFSYYGEMKNKELLKEVEETILEVTQNEKEVQENEGEASPDEKEKTVSQTGDAIGIIEIAALNLKYPVVEGTGSSELSAGIGHIPDTARIGENGNCVLAGHRGSRYGTYFKYLNRLCIGDEVKVTDKEGEVYLYEVAEIRVVGPYDNSVKEQGEERKLTLLTCENSGTMRLIVSCDKKEEEE